MKAQRATVAQAFHKQWYDTTKTCYGSCLQAENAFALWADVVPEDALDAVINQTVHDVMVTNNVHTTTGIIGIKALFEAMSRLGRADVPVLMTQQTTYPSYGYMIHNKYEPATTLWELWNSDTQGPGMNSRNHIMFGSVSSWFYRHVCGIDVPRGAKAYDSVSIRPVGVGTPGAELTSASCEVGSPRGPVKSAWQGPAVPPDGPLANSTCGQASEGASVQLGCPGASISKVSFAHYGTPHGDCEAGLQLDAGCDADITAIVEEACVGEESCAVECSQGKCLGTDLADPCHGTVKHVAVSVECSAPPPAPGPAPSHPEVRLAVMIPLGSAGSVRVPLVAKVGLTPATATILEGTKPVWKGGAFVDGVVGISGAQADRDGVTFTTTSGSYEFVAQLPQASLLVI